ncbi:MAG: hypothetical protein J6A16_02050 [Oscillospiraceae bacterium]|nr:hypothetical protein [Oscillospiraceae bacterium]
MAYRIRRSLKITETLELCGDDGEVEKTLPVTVDIDAIAGELRSHLVALTDAEREMRAASAAGDASQTYQQFGKAVTEVFELCFGKAVTEEIIGFFEGAFVEASLALVPFIYDVILPAANKVIAQRRAALKSLYKRR